MKRNPHVGRRFVMDVRHGNGRSLLATRVEHFSFQLKVFHADAY